MARPSAGVAKELRARLRGRESLLLAVSGGLDSMVMLKCALSLARPLKLTIEVAHLDHALRRASRMDSEFVRRFCATHSVPFHHKRVKRPGPKINIEEWGRRTRYAFFEKIRARRGLKWIVTAHTADDAAETLLMRLLSNKELRGIEREDPSRRLLRPLLSVPRSELEAYGAKHKVPFVQDESNYDQAFFRNRVRLNLMPLLRREFDPRIAETLSARAEALGDDLRCLDKLCLGWLAPLGCLEFGSKRWIAGVREIFARLEPELNWRLAELLLKPKLGFNLGRKHALRFAQFISGSAARVELPSGLGVRRKGGALVFDSHVS